MRAGDAAAFEALFQRFFRRLHAFAESYVGDSETAEDLVADVVVRVWERRAEWRLRGGACSSGRTPPPPRTSAAPAWALRPPPPTPPPGRELAEALELAIERLPERSREAFVLHRRHGLSYALVAEAMEISPAPSRCTSAARSRPCAPTSAASSPSSSPPRCSSSHRPKAAFHRDSPATHLRKAPQKP